MLIKLEIVVLILIAVYTIISIAGAVVSLKKSDDLKRRVKRLERAHAETRGLVHKMMWDNMSERAELDPIKEGESCGSISLDELPG